MSASATVVLAACVLCAVGSSLAAVQNPCDDPKISSLPFCNYSLSVVERVEDLLGRLQAKEKITQLGNTSPKIDGLAIPSYQWWSEALHGVAYSPGVSFGGAAPYATSFPQVIGLAATFNMSLVHLMAAAISTEARAMHNSGQAGLTFFAPNINIYRDPRWGRGQETPGEDPFLTSQYVTQFAQGMQYGEDPRYLKVAVCCKHFAAYDLENWNGTDRHHFNAIVSDQDLVETYFPAFETCVERGLGASVMCSYNSVNGVPSCANDLILNNVMRKQWGFQGFVVSDCGAIADILKTHQYTNSTDATVQVALRAGTDLDCGGFYQQYGDAAYESGAINEGDLDLAVGRLFAFRILLGMFDPPNSQPYCSIGTDQINTPAHQALALEAAQQSMVVLKNDGSLPLSKSVRVALIGPNSNATGTMQGNYNGKAPYLISPLEGLKGLGVGVDWALGCDVPCTNDTGFSKAVDLASMATHVVMVIGLDQTQEREGHDRNEISLPGKQAQLLDAVKGALKPGVPLAVVLMAGGPVDMTWAKANANALVWTGYPGQSGGQALAEVLFGDVNPSGRLPYTMYPADYVNQISFFDMSMRTPPGRTYKFYTGEPVYAFGDGLSYTTFDYKWNAGEGCVAVGDNSKSLRVSRAQLEALGSVNYSVTVTNTGSWSGAVSVLAFMKSDVPGAPLKQLFGFQKVFLDPKQSANLFFAASRQHFQSVDTQGKKSIAPGNYWIQVETLEHRVNII